MRLWTLAALALVLHVFAAFEWTHHWSWRHAVEHTTRETERVVGRSFGVELWVNFGFLGWWLVDVALRYRRGLAALPKWYERLVQFVWVFMFLNATVVFGPAWWRWAILPLIGILALIRPKTIAVASDS